MRCEADVVQACIDLFADRIDRADALVAPAIEQHGQYREFVVGVAANIRTAVDVRDAVFDRAREAQAWARTFHCRTVGQFPGVYGRCLGGLASYGELDLHSAGEQFRDALTLARDSAGAHSHAAQLAGALLAEVEYERGELDAAEQLLAESSKLGAEGGLVEFMIARYGVLARIRALRGSRAEAAELLAEGAAVAEHLNLPRLHTRMIHERVALLLRNGNVTKARILAQSAPDSTGGSGGVAEAIDRDRALTAALIATAEGRHDTAISALTTLLDRVGGRHPRAEVAVRIHLAAAQQRGGRTNQAVRTLAPALRAGSRVGLQRSFLDCGPALHDVLARHQKLVADGLWTDSVGPAPSDYVTALLELSGRGEASRELSPQLRALSAREIEILRLVGLGRSNTRLAADLSLTINTVKWHLKNINAKLGASNRTESVAVVRQAGLLE
jgi:LuxR family maltose regulon positive regulatory protein/serine/threonine-protein kinase PknK